MRSLATVTVAEEGRSTRTRTSESCAGFSVGGRSRCCTPAESNHHRNFVPSLTAWSSTADTRSRAGPIPSSASISESFGTLHFQPVPPSKRFLSMDSAGGLFSRDQAACPGPAVRCPGQRCACGFVSVPTCCDLLVRNMSAANCWSLTDSGVRLAVESIETAMGWNWVEKQKCYADEIPV